MAPVVIVTDSSACLPDSAVRHPSLSVLPIAIVLPDREVLDSPGAAPAVHRALAGDQPIKSYPPSPIKYLQALPDHRGQAALVLTPAAEFTVMFHNASVAASLADCDVEVIDTRTAAAAQGLVVLEVLRALDQGATLTKLAVVARMAARRAELVATLPSLVSLQHSGRVPAPALELASDGGFQPVFRFRQGAVLPALPAGGVEPDPAAALRAVTAAWQSLGGPGAAESVVFHAGAEIQARRLQDLLSSAAGSARRPVPTTIVPFSPAMAVHTGAGCVGVCWLAPAAD